jgi:hypothetical protein
MNWLNKDEAVTACEAFPFLQGATNDGPRPNWHAGIAWKRVMLSS